MTPIRLQLIIDERCKPYESQMDEAVLLASQQYPPEIQVTSQKEYRNFDGVKFVPYRYHSENDTTVESLGVDFAVINQETLKVRLREKDKIDYVILVIDQSNWKQGTGPTWGWNLGEFFNNYQVCLVMGQPNVNGMKMTFAMEIAHGIDNFVSAEIGGDLAALLEVKDFDEDVIHGQTPPWIAYEYAPLFERIKAYIVQVFDKRRLRESFTHRFLKDLVLGQFNDDIKKAQTALKREGTFPIYVNETGYFGEITKQAVQKFQKRYGIISWGTPNTTGYGRIGPKTRAKLNEICS